MMERRMNSNFFSCLKQVEKRLKLDNSSLLQQSIQPNNASIDSLSSPLYLFVDQNHTNVGVKCSTFDDSSDFPIEFLSNSVDFPLTQEKPGRESERNDAKMVNCVEDGVGQVGLLVDDSETPVEFLSNSVDFPLTHQKPCQESVRNDAKMVNFVEDGVGEVGLLVYDSETPVEFRSSSNLDRKLDQNDARIFNCVENDAGGIGLLNENGETPVELRLNSIEYTQTHENPPRKSRQNDAQMVNCVEDGVDEIAMLIELLGLSEREEEEVVNMTCSSCHCGGGFYEKVVGIKGPKCGKEMERLDGWIKHFRSEKIEPFRLAHLLLGKATCLQGDDGGGFEAVEFPSTVEEFLRHDPEKSKQEGNNRICCGGGSD